MPVAFRILPQHDLVFVVFSGSVGIAETAESVAACARHPDFRPGMKHLFDLGAVTGVERDYPAYLALQAKAVENLGAQPEDSLLVYHAPTAPGQQMAALVCRSWDGLPGTVVRVVENEEAACEVLGLRDRRFADLMRSPA